MSTAYKHLWNVMPSADGGLLLFLLSENWIEASKMLSSLDQEFEILRGDVLAVENHDDITYLISTIRQITQESKGKTH